MKNNEWIPVSTGQYPPDETEVQVTYLGYYDNMPRCNEFAYRFEERWYWSIDGEEVRVEITAWKYNCAPYSGK